MNAVDKLLPDGSVSPEWLASLGGRELQCWVSDLLHDADPDIPVWVNDAPHRVLLAAYREGPEGVWQVISDAVSGYVIEMADGDGWGGMAGGRLLFVAGEVCGREIAGRVRAMVQSRRYLDLSSPIPGDLHGRMLQTLVKLGVQEGLDFWLEQARLCPDRYLPVAMRGLDIAGRNPFELLTLVDADWNDGLLADVEMVVDILDMHWGSEWVAKAVAACGTLIPAEALAALPQAETAAQAALAGNREPDPRSSLAWEALEGLAGVADRRLAFATYGVACIYFWAGRTDDAVSELQRALAQGHVAWMDVSRDRLWDSLRADERYLALERRYGHSAAETPPQ